MRPVRALINVRRAAIITLPIVVLLSALQGASGPLSSGPPPPPTSSTSEEPARFADAVAIAVIDTPPSALATPELAPSATALPEANPTEGASPSASASDAQEPAQPVATQQPVAPPPPPPPPAATPPPPPPATPAPAPSGCSITVAVGDSVPSAMERARPGDRVCLRGGTHAQNFTVDPPDGTSGARITLTSAPGERAVIAGLVSFSGLNYWTITNMGFTWNGGSADDHMVKINGGVGWVVDGVEMWGARSFANLLIWGSPTNWVIRNSLFRDTYGGESNGDRSHNLYVMAPNGTGGLIEGNSFRNAPKGNNVKLSGSSEGTDGTDNVVFRGNSLSGANRANLLLGNAANNNLIEGNSFSNSGDGWALRLWDLRGTGNLARNNSYSQGTFCNDYNSPTLCGQVVGTGNSRN